MFQRGTQYLHLTRISLRKHQFGDGCDKPQQPSNGEVRKLTAWGAM